MRSGEKALEEVKKRRKILWTIIKGYSDKEKENEKPSYVAGGLWTLVSCLFSDLLLNFLSKKNVCWNFVCIFLKMQFLQYLDFLKHDLSRSIEAFNLKFSANIHYIC